MALQLKEKTSEQTPLRYPSLANDNLLDALRLIRSENVGPITFFNLLRYYGTAAKALDAIPHLAQRGGMKRVIQVCPKNKAETELEKIKLFGATLVMYGSAEYPAMLTQIYDPPPILALTGHAHLWKHRECIAMVGARNASANGCNFARKLAKELSESGYTVVSGMARGIDTHAHHGALELGTVGVIAGGIDNIYPPENEKLFEQMRTQAAVLSENPFGTEPLARTFPARNRIIAGMCRGTIVVEAARKSGSLITAKYALENGRDVFAVPGSPMDPRAQGSNDLIKQGAALITGLSDIRHALTNNKGMSEPDLFSYADKTLSEPDEHTLADARRIITEKLAMEPVSIEDILVQTQLPPNVLLTILLEKELAGMIQRHPGNKVSLRAPV